MIIIDTSIWVDHFKQPRPAIVRLIDNGGLALHPYVFGELALGGFPGDGLAFEAMMDLASAPVASATEMLAFISWAKLRGTGIGYVDTHLLISARLLGDGKVLTSDGRLRAQAERLGVAYAL